jgi:hypothetical protein
MESKVANAARQALFASARRMTHEQRLRAFLVHSQLMLKLHAVGQKIRSDRKRQTT